MDGVHIEDTYGSFAIQDLHGKNMKIRLERERLANASKMAREAREARKAAATAARKKVDDEFKACKGGEDCSCGLTPCPQLQLLKCNHCLDVKGKVCQKFECKKKRAELGEVVCITASRESLKKNQRGKGWNIMMIRQVMRKMLKTGVT